MKVLTIEGRAKRTHLVQKHANTPNVRFIVICVALHDLRAEIVRGAHNSRSHLGGRLEDASDAKVAKLDHPILHEEDVLGFDIAMKNLTIVTVLECQADLREPVKDLVLIEVVLGHLRLALVLRLILLDLQGHVTTC